jgi:hypothetical protein
MRRININEYAQRRLSHTAAHRVNSSGDAARVTCMQNAHSGQTTRR